MKQTLKNCILLAFTALLVVFCIGYLLSGPVGTESGILAGIGSMFENVQEKEIISESDKVLEKVMSVDFPTVKYVGGARTVGDEIPFRELLQVCLSGGTFQSGQEENGFYLYFDDIRNEIGNSVVTYLKTEDVEALEEIPSPFIFDKEREILYFHKSGVFTMYIKVYMDNGSNTLYEVTLPVETG